MKHIALGLVGLFASLYLAACKSNNGPQMPPASPSQGGYVQPHK